MITIEEAKRLARELSSVSDVGHSRVLEAVAHASGFRDWNTMAAADPGAGSAQAAAPGTGSAQASGPDAPLVVPVLRVFDHAIARSFYCDHLGFTWQWEHRFEPDLPVYAEVSLDGRALHLSEHHGDATPGAGVMITVPDLRTYRAGLLAQAHPNSRPGIERNACGLTMLVTDPFGNRLTFWERSAPDRT